MAKFQITIEIPDSTDGQSIALSCLKDILHEIDQAYEGSQAMIPEEKRVITLRELILGSGLEVIREIKQLQNSTDQISSLVHVRVHQQFVRNVCGYHASFNILLITEALKAGINYVPLLSSGHFWQFKAEICQYLQEYKRLRESNNNKWPWRDSDVTDGDFERSYLNICLKSNDRFISTLSSSKDVRVLYHSWEYQFGRVIAGEPQQRYLQDQMKEFQDFKAVGDKRIIFVMMLGITNHWGAFIALKTEVAGTEFIYLDSRNRDYLNWDEKAIVEWVQAEQLKRQEMGRKSMSDFDILVQSTCVKDIQESLEILCQCLLGNTTLHQYQSNGLFIVFEKQFKNAINYEEMLTGKNIDENLTKCITYSKDFYHTIQSFLKSTSLKELTPTNRDRFNQMKHIFGLLQNANRIKYPSNYHQNYIEPLNNLLVRAKL